jgi:hypothetical protein
MTVENYFEKVGREINIVRGGIAEGVFDEAWKRSKDPLSLCGTVAKDAMIGAGVAAACTVAPEVALPVVAYGTAALWLEDSSGRKESWAKDARIFDACKSAWNDPTKERQAKCIVSKELGQQTFDMLLFSVAGLPGMTVGTRFAEGKMAEIAEKALDSKRMVMSDLGNGAMQTRIGSSVVTTHADGTVVKEYASGLTQRHIPMNSSDFIVTERAPNGTLTMILPDGTRMLESPTGRMYSFDPDGSYEIQRQTGLRLNVAPDGTKVFTHPNGTATKFSSRGKERFIGQQQ